MAPALDATSATARDHDWKAGGAVRVAAAHSASEEHDRVVEQCPIAIACGSQSVEEPGEELRFVGVDRAEASHLFRIVPVVRERVMAFGNSNLWIALIG